MSDDKKTLVFVVTLMAALVAAVIVTAVLEHAKNKACADACRPFVVEQCGRRVATCEQADGAYEARPVQK